MNQKKEEKTGSGVEAKASWPEVSQGLESWSKRSAASFKFLNVWYKFRQKFKNYFLIIWHDCWIQDGPNYSFLKVALLF